MDDRKSGWYLKTLSEASRSDAFVRKNGAEIVKICEDILQDCGESPLMIYRFLSMLPQGQRKEVEKLYLPVIFLLQRIEGRAAHVGSIDLAITQDKLHYVYDEKSDIALLQSFYSHILQPITAKPTNLKLAEAARSLADIVRRIKS